MHRYSSVVAFALIFCNAGVFAGEVQTVATGFKRHDVGGSVTIDLPDQWMSRSLPIEWPGAKDWRFSTVELEMGVTMLPVPDQPNGPDISQLVVRGMTPYLQKSKETQIEPVSFTSGNLLGAHGTLHSRAGAPGFRVFGGAEYACVTTAVVKAPGAVYSISIASTSCTGSEHQAALRGVTAMQATSSGTPLSTGTTELELPDGGKLAFAVPPMKKVKETSKRGRYQYLASSMNEVDKRFNLSAYIEPSECERGKSTREVTQCFLDKADRIPGIVMDTLETECFDQYCNVIYGTKVEYEGREIRQLHVNLIFAYREKSWGHVHLSIIGPTDDDVGTLSRFPVSLKYQ